MPSAQTRKQEKNGRSMRYILLFFWQFCIGTWQVKTELNLISNIFHHIRIVWTFYLCKDNLVT